MCLLPSATCPLTPALDARTWTLAANTLLLSGATCAIAVPVGSSLAFLLTRTNLPGRRVGLAALGLMLFVPLYLHAAGWLAGFGVLGWFPLATGSRLWFDDAWVGAVWVHAAAAVPWVVLIVGAGFRLVEPELEEQALLDGSPRQVFFNVTLRSAAPAVGVAAVWVAVVAAGEMAVTDLFVIRTYAEEVYTGFALSPDAEAGPMGLVPGVTICGLLVLAAVWLCGRVLPGDRPLSLRGRHVFFLGPWRWPAATLVFAVLVVLIAVPLGNLAYKAGITVSQAGTERVREWSPVKMARMVGTAPWRFGEEFGWSLSIAALAAAAAVAVAALLAWFSQPGAWLGSRSKAGRVTARAVMLLVAAACLAVPGPVVGVGLIALLNRPELPLVTWLYDQSILAPWLALSIRSLPLAVLVMWHALRTVPGEMLEAAAVDGAGTLWRLLFVALPGRLPAAALAWVVAFAVALGDLAASVLVLPPGVDTLSRRVFGLLHSGQEAEVAGICLAIVGMFAGVAALGGWLAKRWGRSVTGDRSRSADQL